MRIGFIVNRDVSNINYRATGPAGALDRAGHQVEMAFVGGDLRVDIERLRRCDAVHVYRLTNKETIAYIDVLRRHGVAITWDNDDDIRLLHAAGRRHVRYSALQAEQDFRNQTKLFPRLDVLTTTSALLAERFAAVGGTNVVQIPNFLQPEQYARPERHDGLVIGWVAGLEHEFDAKTLSISEVLGRILDRHPNVRVISVGVRLDLDADRYEHHRVIQFPDLPNTIRRFDIGIAPIADVPMNHARSDVKIKEYAAAGVPWLASARGPYAGYGGREGGMLVEDGEWEDALEAVISSRLRRFAMRRHATAWAKSQSIDRNVGLWIEVFEQAIANARSRRPGGTHNELPVGRRAASPQGSR